MKQVNQLVRWTNKLCSPARLYFVLSIALMIASIVQNLFGIGTVHRVGNGRNRMCVGVYDCHSSLHPLLLFALEVGYIFLWTWVLNQICRAGYVNLSWFILFFPFILFFIMLGAFVLAVMYQKI